MRKPKIDPRSVIYCGNGDDAYLAYAAMFRYAFGRMTYMPDAVIGIIKRNKENIPDCALKLINTELEEEADRYERVYKEHHEHGSNYGRECDRKAWITFHEWIKEQIKERSKK
jgi:hypothetical protein